MPLIIATPSIHLALVGTEKRGIINPYYNGPLTHNTPRTGTRLVNGSSKINILLKFTVLCGLLSPQLNISLFHLSPANPKNRPSPFFAISSLEFQSKQSIPQIGCVNSKFPTLLSVCFVSREVPHKMSFYSIGMYTHLYQIFITKPG